MVVAEWRDQLNVWVMLVTRLGHTRRDTPPRTSSLNQPPQDRGQPPQDRGRHARMEFWHRTSQLRLGRP